MKKDNKMAILRERPATPNEALKSLHPMIVKQANRFAKNRRDMFDDYYQEGAIGLMHAYNRFDASKGMAFSSYAYMWIMTCVKDVAVKDWKRYNSTAAKPATDIMGILGSDPSECENSITVNEILKVSNKEDRIIIRGKLEGKTFDDIAKDLSTEEHTYTLHQVRTRWIALCSDLEKMIAA
jgi:RNA polymerase sigma factor (sigma-70 family)